MSHIHTVVCLSTSLVDSVQAFTDPEKAKQCFADELKSRGCIATETEFEARYVIFARGESVWLNYDVVLDEST